MALVAAHLERRVTALRPLNRARPTRIPLTIILVNRHNRLPILLIDLHLDDILALPLQYLRLYLLLLHFQLLNHVFLHYHLIVLLLTCLFPLPLLLLVLNLLLEPNLQLLVPTHRFQLLLLLLLLCILLFSQRFV